MLPQRLGNDWSVCRVRHCRQLCQARYRNSQQPLYWVFGVSVFVYPCVCLYSEQEVVVVEDGNLAGYCWVYCHVLDQGWLQVAVGRRYQGLGTFEVVQESNDCNT